MKEFTNPSEEEVVKWLRMAWAKCDYTDLPIFLANHWACWGWKQALSSGISSPNDRQPCVELGSPVEDPSDEDILELSRWHNISYELIDGTVASPYKDGTDEELLNLDQLRDSWNAQADAMNTWDELGLDEIIVWAQRQALARWGSGQGLLDNSAPVPVPVAAREVAELVAWLRENAEDERQMCESSNRASLNLDRVADLLQQRHPTPVPVSERLPGVEDCDAEGLCWVWNTTAYTWGLFRLDLTAHSHWLPAHALPRLK